MEQSELVGGDSSPTLLPLQRRTGQELVQLSVRELIADLAAAEAALRDGCPQMAEATLTREQDRIVRELRRRRSRPAPPSRG